MWTVPYPFTAIPEGAIPKSVEPGFQYLLDTYASEANKLISTWKLFDDSDLTFKPHPKSVDVANILRHQFLSERRFFADFAETEEPSADEVIPAPLTIESSCERMRELVMLRLPQFASKQAAWWHTEASFFDVRRQRIWIFWRRVLHTAHHRTQLTVYLRLLNKPVPAIYGPSADNSWDNASPTY